MMAWASRLAGGTDTVPSEVVGISEGRPEQRPESYRLTGAFFLGFSRH